MNRVLLLFVFLLLASTGCEPEEGPEGPQGPQGELGLQGEQGPRGEPGTANVIYSDWIPFESSLWTTPFSFFSQNRRSYTITEDSISTKVIDNGFVMVYVRFGGTFNNIQLLPTIQSITQVKNQVLDFYLRLNEIVIIYYNLNDTDDPGTIGNGNQYRYVIIPGGTALLKSGMVDINMSYEDLCKLYNIPVE